MYITFASEKQVNKAEPTLALKPRDITRNPKQERILLKEKLQI